MYIFVCKVTNFFFTLAKDSVVFKVFLQSEPNKQTKPAMLDSIAGFMLGLTLRLTSTGEVTSLHRRSRSLPQPSGEP